MLVRNSSALRNEIMQNLRNEYSITVTAFIERIQMAQPDLYYDALQRLMEETLGDSYMHFLALNNMVSNHNILPQVETASIVMVNNINSTAERIFNSNLLNEKNMLYYANDHIIYNLQAKAIMPSYRIEHDIGPNVKAMFDKKENMNELWLRINIVPKLEEDYDEIEQIFLSPIIHDLHKIKIEYTHYVSILDYFLELFDELPSLNQMHKACPTILNYVSDSTRKNLFKTSKEKHAEKLEDLKPSDDVALALARNKLRGKH